MIPVIPPVKSSKSLETTHFQSLTESDQTAALGKAILTSDDLNKLMEEKRYSCELLVAGGKAQAYYMYDDYLQEQGKVFFVRKASFTSKASADRLSVLNRICLKALDIDAEKIEIYNPRDSIFLYEMQKMGFNELRKKGEDLSYHTLSTPKGESQIPPGKKRKLQDLPVEDTSYSQPTQQSAKRMKYDNPRNHSSRPPKEHLLPMKGTIYFEYIMSGIKKYEGRVSGLACQKMEVGDHLKLFDRRAGWGIICEISSKDYYQGFREMLQAKGVVCMLPQLEQKSKSLSTADLLNEGVRVYNSFPGANRVSQYGAAAIGVKFLRKI